MISKFISYSFRPTSSIPESDQQTGRDILRRFRPMDTRGPEVSRRASPTTNAGFVFTRRKFFVFCVIYIRIKRGGGVILVGVGCTKTLKNRNRGKGEWTFEN